jgi:hypothetical protein
VQNPSLVGPLEEFRISRKIGRNGVVDEQAPSVEIDNACWQ